MPDSALIDYSVAAFIFLGMVLVVMKIIDLTKAMSGSKKDPTVDLTRAINELTGFLREEKAAQKEINRATTKSFEQLGEDMQETKQKLDKVLDAINGHVISCQKCMIK